VLSLVVGVILSLFEFRFDNILERIGELLEAVYNLGFDSIKSVLEYLALGAIVVVPIWLVARLIKTTGRPDPKL
jgi:hypothetical protein